MSRQQPAFAYIRRLEAELEVRTELCLFPHIPESFRRGGYRSAYSSGYESGWRNKGGLPPYAREHLRRAYRQGFDDGHDQAEAAIRKVIDGKK
jgi:hypothetical protein